MLNQMTVSDSEKVMLEVMRAIGLTPSNLAQMARSHAIKIKSIDAASYDKLTDALLFGSSRRDN